MSKNAGQGKTRLAKPRMIHDYRTYAAILAAYRRAPGNHSAVSKDTGFARDALRYVWNKGWPERATFARPISVVIAEERDVARANAQERARREAELVEADRERGRLAVKTAIDEEQHIMATARGSLKQLATIVTQTMPIAAACAGIVAGAVLDLTDPAHPKPLKVPRLTPVEAMRVLRDYSLVMSRISDAARICVELGRLDRGQSTANVQAVAELDDAQIIENLEMLAQVREHLVGAGLVDAPDPEPGPVH